MLNCKLKTSESFLSILIIIIFIASLFKIADHVLGLKSTEINLNQVYLYIKQNFLINLSIENDIEKEIIGWKLIKQYFSCKKLTIGKGHIKS